MDQSHKVVIEDGKVKIDGIHRHQFPEIEVGQVWIDRLSRHQSIKITSYEDKTLGHGDNSVTYKSVLFRYIITGSNVSYAENYFRERYIYVAGARAIPKSQGSYDDLPALLRDYAVVFRKINKGAHYMNPDRLDEAADRLDPD